MIQPPAICSWAWSNILKLRGEVRCNFQHIIGNGEKTSLWYDYWLPIGPIVLAKGERVIYDAGLGRNPLVAAIIFEGAWRWPVASSIDLIELKNTTHQLALPNCGVDDKIRWRGNASGMFSVHEAWLNFRTSQSIVPWHKLIWHNKATPWHAFVLWLAVRNRLNTEDKLIAYGVISSVSCVFCRLKEESHDHLFFNAPSLREFGQCWQPKLLFSGKGANGMTSSRGQLCTWKVKHWLKSLAGSYWQPLFIPYGRIEMLEFSRTIIGTSFLFRTIFVGLSKQDYVSSKVLKQLNQIGGTKGNGIYQTRSLYSFGSFCFFLVLILSSFAFSMDGLSPLVGDPHPFFDPGECPL